MQNEPDGNITNAAYAQMYGRDGALFDRAGDDPRAYDCLALALALNPTADVLDNYGIVCARMNHMPEAIEALRQANRLDPGNPVHAQHLTMVQRYEAARLDQRP